MEVFKNKFLLILYNAEKKICIGNWTIETENAENNEFKDWNNELVNKFQEHKPTGFLANTKDYKFIITPDLQQWATTNIFEEFAKAGLEKIAMLVSKDLFPQVSLEQFIDEYKGGKIETKYFKIEEEAMKWLLKK